MTAEGFGPFGKVRELTWSTELPRLLRVRRTFGVERVSDIEAATREQLEAVRSRIEPGMRIAITVGSRGIANIVEIIRSTGRFLKDAGATPFVVPAMGSHGGGDVLGQRDVLAHLGVTEESVEMTIGGSDDLVEVGKVPGGPPVLVERSAFEADGILAVNRIKPHTDFHGEIESGLAKILAIGLGKQPGASGLHATGPDGLEHFLPLVAREIVRTDKVIGGLAILENEEHETRRLVFVAPSDIGGALEHALLEEAYVSLARLPFDDLDVVVVRELGKDKSGTGVDPNVLGRMRIEGVAEPATPRIAVVVALGLSSGSGGNALGLGLCDITTLRAIEEIDLYKTYLNALTAGLGGVRRAALPIVLPTERDAIAAGLSVCGVADAKRRRVAFIADTLSLAELLVSETLLDEVEAHPELDVLEELGAMRFDSEDRLLGWGS